MMYLKYIVVALVASCSLFPFGVSAQINLDSTTQQYLDSVNLTSKQHTIFNEILKKRNRHITTKMRDTSYSHVFFTEYYNSKENSYKYDAHYFNKMDSLAKKVVINNKKEKVEKYYNPMYGVEIEKIYPSQVMPNKMMYFKEYGRVQKIEYDSIVLAHRSCVRGPDWNLAIKNKGARRKEIQATYKICTYINLNTGTTYISFQIPVKNPRLKIQPYNSVWDF